jgi:hypothetical protein
MEGPTIITIVIVDLKEPSKQEKEKKKSPRSLTQEAMSLHK